MNTDIVVFGAAADAAMIQAVCQELQARGFSCAAFPLDDENVASWHDSGVISAVSACRIPVLVFSAAANNCAAVGACVSEAFRKKKRTISFRLDDLDYSPAIDYCLGPLQYINASKEYDKGIQNLLMAVDRIIHPPKEPSKPYGYRFRWGVAACILVALIVTWRVWGPGRHPSFAHDFAQIMEAGLDGIAQECPRGRLLAMVLDLESGELAASERKITGSGIEKTLPTLALRSAELDRIPADRLMIPVLAAVAMKQGKVASNEALGADNWQTADASRWKCMLGERVLEKGLAEMHLSTALQGRGVSANVQRFSVTPYHLSQGYGMIAVEAAGARGYNFCGGRENALSILRRMRYKDGDEIVSGAVLREKNVVSDPVPRQVENMVGVVSFDDPFCVLFVRVEFELQTEADVKQTSAEPIWRTLAATAVLCEKKRRR